MARCILTDSMCNSQVAREKEPQKQRQITLRLLRLTFLGTFVAVLCLLCVPEWIFTDYLFSQEFKGITSVIRGLSVGIVACQRSCTIQCSLFVCRVDRSPYCRLFPYSGLWNTGCSCYFQSGFYSNGLFLFLGIPQVIT